MSATIDDEILIIENSGEMPEVAFHGCLYFLAVDPEGPQLTLGLQDRQRLRLAVIEGYRKIILRDLTLENRGKGLYRGLARAIVNVQRLLRFCARERLDPSRVTAEVCERLHDFLVVEHAEVAIKEKRSCINCTEADLLEFFTLIGFDATRLPDGWRLIVCP
ncbi:MAG: hypothetical protein PHI06_00080 [Desulfobulbaceae bacterium]|nr:hypothetical protein [Desulfobulbaceae bacterium]